MRMSRRMKRMGRRSKGVPLSLTSLMDVFTNLVFFLLLSQGVTEIDEPPKEIKLPSSYTEAKPRPSVTIMVSSETISIQGEPTISTAEVFASQSDLIPSIKEKLTLIKSATIGVSDQTKDGKHEVTILANNSIPFKVMKKLMTTATVAGYNKISLATNQDSGVTAPPTRN